MPRRGGVPKRDVLPDPIYGSKVVTKLVNQIMLDGKKGTAQTIVYDAFTAMSEKLGANGFLHYEISNFARPGFEGKHNLKYWSCEEYLGLGPSAHSFIGGKRFYYPRDINYFENDGEPIPDGEGGDEEEYIMLRLRLKDGIIFENYERKYGKEFPQDIIKKTEKFVANGLMKETDKSIALTEKGFLLSNPITD